MGEQRKELKDVTAGDRVWRVRGQHAEMVIVSKVTPQQIAIGKDRYRRTSGFSIAGGYLAGCLAVVRDANEITDWETKKAEERRERDKRIAVADAITKERDALNVLFNGRPYGSPSAWVSTGDDGKWNLEFSHLTREQVEQFAAFVRGMDTK